MEARRKRLRSSDNDGEQQRKVFVSQKIVDQTDKNLMLKVYGELKVEEIAPKCYLIYFTEKTLSMMFQRSKTSVNTSPNTVHNTSLNSDDGLLDTVDDVSLYFSSMRSGRNFNYFRNSQQHQVANFVSMKSSIPN